jgi:phosphoserine phosphatase RsbU/P
MARFECKSRGQVIWQGQSAATLLGVRHLRQALALVLSVHPISVEHQQDCVLGISELMTNVVRHSSPPARKLRLRLSQHQQILWLELNDDGAPFDPSHPNVQTELTTQGHPRPRVSGYGLALVSLSIPTLCYRRKAWTNHYRVQLAA